MKSKPAKPNRHYGSSFESFLKEQGYLEEATAKALKRVKKFARRLEEA